MLSRRQFTVGAFGLAAAATANHRNGSLSFTRALGAPARIEPGETVAVHLEAAERPTALPCFGGRSLPMWTFTDGSWPPVIRLALGDRLEAKLVNRLLRPGELTSIHWHGIRLPNDQDGVPYLVQRPLQVGESCEYGFTPPDAGTYFFHTHCNTVEQLGRGLEGVLIVEGDTTEAYDDDRILFIRDWQVDQDFGEFNSFFTLRGAGRAGTFAPLRSVNGDVDPEFELPASGDCRLRLINADATRIMELEIENAEAAIIAIDGIAVRPFPMFSWRMGPAMRIDVVLRAPPKGGVARLVDHSTPKAVQLAHFVSRGEPLLNSFFDPAPLRVATIPEPDLKTASLLEFIFRATDTGQSLALPDDQLGIGLDALCLSSRTFWTINDRAWPDRGHANLPPPLAVLDRGRSYVFSLKNESEFSHPIHFHGHTFKLLSSDKQHLIPHHTDTMLLLPRETAKVAFVADNPGDWMFHCHIIEHQETGMMQYIRVS
jgi:FtsP/CotA-like multicopper oxidase with cupredoxin domain